MDPAAGRLAAPATQHPYAYGLNSPLLYVDPSGRDAGVLRGNGKYRFILETEGLEAAEEAVLEDYGRVNDLEGMAIISDLVAATYRDWDPYLAEMGRVFTGWPGEPGDVAYVKSVVDNTRGRGCEFGMGRDPADCPKNGASGLYWADTGFDPDFRDEHNQPYHTWTYIRQTTRRGRPWWERLAWYQAARWVGEGANAYHELYESCSAQWKHETGTGNSWQDYFLSVAGMDIGASITSGLIRSPLEVGDAMRARLGPAGPGSRGMVPLFRAVWPLAGYEKQ